MPSELWLGVGIFLLVLLFVTGAPMYVAFLAGCIPLFLFYVGVPPGTLPHMAMASVQSQTLVAIPLFILLGNIMSASGAAAALFNLVRSFTGGFKAGLGIASIFACALFGLMCGSCVATALAIGTVVTPELLKSGYTRPHAAAITGVAGTLGIMIPPSIAMIILAEITETSLSALFMAGLIPGFMAAGLLSVACYFVTRRDPAIKSERRHSSRERWSAFLYALPSFVIPGAVLGVIYLGIATPTESAAVGVVAAFLVGLLFYKGLNWEKIRGATKDAVIATAAVYCIVFGAVIFGRILGFAKIPQGFAAAIGALGLSKIQFMVVFLFLFFAFGMIFDAFALYYVCLTPLLGTIQMYDFNMVWFSIIFVFVIMIGQITPPVGVTLYAAAIGAQAPTDKVIKRSFPYLAAMIVACFAVVFIPSIALYLPGLMAK